MDTPDQYERECARIFSTDEDWGNAPAIVVLSDTNSNWQKAMIVNTETLVCTFRSLTKDATYMPKKDLNKGNEWWLDNAMMDANVQQMRIFHSHLKKILENAR